LYHPWLHEDVPLPSNHDSKQLLSKTVLVHFQPKKMIFLHNLILIQWRILVSKICTIFFFFFCVKMIRLFTTYHSWRGSCLYCTKRENFTDYSQCLTVRKWALPWKTVTQSFGLVPIVLHNHREQVLNMY
jgi:hypothetical protein